MVFLFILCSSSFQILVYLGDGVGAVFKTVHDAMGSYLMSTAETHA